MVARCAPRHSRLPHAARAAVGGLARLEPLLQGELDGLCGLYSVLNAFRLAAAAWPPLSKAQINKLYILGAEYLDERGKLCGAVSGSMGTRTWIGLAKHLGHTFEREFGRQVKIEKPFLSDKRLKRADFILSLEGKLAAGSPLLILLQGKHWHYTVLAGYSPTRFRLFDSAGHRFLAKSHCGPSAAWPHHLEPRWVMTLRLVDPTAVPLTLP